ncbi:MAG TPA: hypothetical protein VIF57_05445 [Polyangia bacterium]|jgi:hypothetical protein
MKNGISRKQHIRTSIVARLMVGVATLAAGVFLIRALPDLIRYMRVRRM